MINFDNGSTSFPKAPGVGKVMADFIEKGAFNINRGNYEGSYNVELEVLECRERLARLFGCKHSKNVIFTPNITYSLNMVLKGVLKKGDHIITSSMEHNAVMRPLTQLKEQGVSFDLLQADEEGSIKASDINELIKDNTKAVVMLQASNVCGTIMPIQEIGQICRERNLLFILDTAQSAGDLPINMEEEGIDFLTFTGHKALLGPQGIGGFMLSKKGEKEIEPLISGGTGSFSNLLQMPEILPDRFESGTLNLPGILGLNKALEYLEKRGIRAIHQEKMNLTKQFLEGLKEIPAVRIVGKKSIAGRGAVVSLDFKGRDNARVAYQLESEYQILTRVGLHCAPMAHKSLKTFPEGTVRFSFGAFNQEEEVLTCLKAIREIVSL
ncbi:MAG TPA: aminotransferase class V-fold PLP-dependent enzyme [Candidatus Dorea intestinavium]|nr:aminotransferase class V-fold PLP-dependent enzyme [Candidatus Dorea intestinavium]